jgi:hypothetical protein
MAVPVASPAGTPAPAEPPGTLVPPPIAHTMGFRRATSRELAFVLPGAHLVDLEGVAVARLAATDDPKSSTDDDEVTVVAVDQGTGTIYTNAGLLKVVTWNGTGSVTGALSHPTDVAIDRSGLVGVTDTGNRRVVILQHDGAGLTAVHAYGGFLEPLGIAADGSGGFYVCDRRLQAVFRLDAKTGTRTSFGLEAAFDRPIDVATIMQGDPIAPGRKRVLVVSDKNGARLRVFDPAGSVRASREASSLRIAGASFDAVELDLHENVFAVDRRGNRIHKLRDDLYPLTTFGSRGTEPGQFLAPRGIAIHRRFGQVFLTEEDGGQYLWIGTDVERFQAQPDGDGVRFDYVVTEESVVQLRVLDGSGRRVATLVDRVRQHEGPQQGTWDGSDGSGRRVPAGSYFAEILAHATYASGSTFEKRLTQRFVLPGAGARP